MVDKLDTMSDVKLHYAKFFTRQDFAGNQFENIRCHTLDYILRKGKVVLRNKLKKGRRRPEFYEEEYALVNCGNAFYYFHVERRHYLKNGARDISIVIGSNDVDDLKDRVEDLLKNCYDGLHPTSLR